MDGQPMTRTWSLVKVIFVCIWLVSVVVQESVVASGDLRDPYLLEINYVDPWRRERRNIAAKFDIYATPYATASVDTCKALVAPEFDRIDNGEDGDSARGLHDMHYCQSILSQSLRWRAIFTTSDTCFNSEPVKHEEILFGLSYAYEMDSSIRNRTACLLGEFSAHFVVPAVMSPHVSNVLLILDDREVSSDIRATTDHWDKLQLLMSQPSFQIVNTLAVSYHKTVTVIFHSTDASESVYLPPEVLGTCDIVQVNGFSKQLTHQENVATADEIVDMTSTGSASTSSEQSLLDLHDLIDPALKRFHALATSVLMRQSSSSSQPSESLSSPPKASIDSSRSRIIFITNETSSSPSFESFGRIDWLYHSTWFRNSFFSHHTDSNGFTARSYGVPEHSDELSTIHIGETREILLSSSHHALQRCDLTNPFTQLFIVISRNLRVFADTAFGLQHALRSLGYRNVYILVDTSVFTLSFLRSRVSRDCRNRLLQIVLDPHDVMLFTNHYVAVHMEQPWSNITFGWGKYRYRSVLQNAVSVWTFSNALLHDPLDNGNMLTTVDVEIVPLFLRHHRRNRIATQLWKDFLQLSSEPTRSFADISVANYSEAVALSGLVHPSAIQSILPARVNPATFNTSALLFFGSGSPRRAHWLQQVIPPLVLFSNVSYRINSGGWEAAILDSDRDMHVSAAQVVINVNTHEQSVLELHRISYLLSMGKCIISERGKDLQLAHELKDVVVFVDSPAEMYEQIVYFLTHDEQRWEMERKAWTFSTRMQSDVQLLDRAMQRVIDKLRREH